MRSYSIPAYSSDIRTASSHGALLGGTYTATLGAFSNGTASMLFAAIVPRTSTTSASVSCMVETPSNAASRCVVESSGNRKLPLRKFSSHSALVPRRSARYVTP